MNGIKKHLFEGVSEKEMKQEHGNNRAHSHQTISIVFKGWVNCFGQNATAQSDRCKDEHPTEPINIQHPEKRYRNEDSETIAVCADNINVGIL